MQLLGNVQQFCTRIQRASQHRKLHVRRSWEDDCQCNDNEHILVFILKLWAKSKDSKLPILLQESPLSSTTTPTKQEYKPPLAYRLQTRISGNCRGEKQKGTRVHRRTHQQPRYQSPQPHCMSREPPLSLTLSKLCTIHGSSPAPFRWTRLVHLLFSTASFTSRMLYVLDQLPAHSGRH